MEDRVYNLIKKMYSELAGKIDKVDQRLDNVDQRLDKVDQRLDNVDQRLDKVDQKLDKVDQRLVIVDQRLDKVDSRLDCLELEVKTVSKNVIKLENDLQPKIEIALDGYKQIYEKLQEHDKRFDRLESTVIEHDIKLRAIK